ncbi:MAG: hypothetical protein J5755_00125 [Clostridia bacterium]|nr:hypothetical protein [Clostridia bacterium]
MKAKWIILIVVCLVAAMVCGLTLVACDEDEHVHEYSSQITTPATCGQPGVKTFTCACGDTYTEAIEPTGQHVWNDGVESTPATCVEDGEALYTCTVCGATKTEPIACVGHHDWDQGVVTEPTCVEDGQTLYTCQACGATRSDPIACVGHHDWDQGVVTEPTCGEDGETVYTCQVCGDTYSEPIYATGEHDWDEGEITTPSTCSAKGVKTYTCSVCGDTKEEELPLADHDWDDGTVLIEPTCDSEGSIRYTCRVCNKKKKESVEKTAHTLTELARVEPTCDKDGYIQSSCSVCRQIVYTPIPSTGHDLSFSRTVAPTCTAQGYDVYTCSVCHASVNKNFVDELGHDFDFSQVPEDDYFTMAPCTRQGCSEGLRRESPETLKKEMVCAYTEADKERIDQLWADMSAHLASVDPYDENLHGYVKDSALYKENRNFEKNFYDVFMEEFYYITEQYQYAYIDSCVYDDNQHRAISDLISNYRSDLITNYYSLFRTIYETKYREYFFSKEDGWTDEDIQTALEYSDTYGGGELAELNKKITSLESRFNQLDQDTVYKDVGGAFTELYTEFVETENQIAVFNGYDNYMDYAYDVVYGREYTVEQTTAIHDYIKTNFGRSHYNALRNAATWYEAACEHDKYFNALAGSTSAFTSRLVNQAIIAYFNEMASDTSTKPIDFFQTANDLFRNGNYWQGKANRAFTWWIRAAETPVLYFGPEGYSDAFTFIHEFGHYYNDVYNDGASMSMDLNETHSQGNEMMFASFLKNWLADKARPYTAEAIMSAQLVDGVQTILLCTAVDEVESIIYSGTYSGSDEAIAAIVADGLEPSEYNALGDAVFDSYGVKDYSYYWRFVTITSPGYYISYAMSMISSLEVWAKAQTDSFAAAKEAYLKLYTYTDEEENAYVDHDGDLISLLGYADVLVYAGFTSPFEEATYTAIGACLDTFCAAATDDDELE